jgi:hypothetical protein
MNKFKRKWMEFPIFILFSIILYSFVIHNDKAIDFVPDKNDSLKTNQPKVDVKVNKKFDEKGNLILYDSSYSIIYNSNDADIQIFNLESDSIFSQFKNNMMGNDFFKGFPDMGYQNDFFNRDPFENMKRMQEMMNKMFPELRKDTIVIQPQQNIPPAKQYIPENMITL